METYREESGISVYGVDVKKNERVGLGQLDRSGQEAPDVSARERFLDRYFKVQVSDLLNSVGSDKKYQRRVVVVLAFLNFFYAFVGFMIPYVFFMPEFLCVDGHGNRFACPEPIACANPHGFIPKSEVSSVVTEFSLYCDRKGLRMLNQGLFVVLGGAFAFVANIISDRVGRLPIFAASYVCTVLGTFFSLVSDNLFGITLGNVLSWTGMDIFLSMQVLYINEVIGSGLRSKSVGIVFLFWGIGGIVVNFSNAFIVDYKINYLIQLITLVVAGLGYLSFVESPFLLYKLKKIKQLYQTLVYIGLTNEKPMGQLEETLRNDLGLNFIIRHDIEELMDIQIHRKRNSKVNKMKSSFRFIVKTLKNRSFTSRLFCVLFVAGNIFMGYALSLLIPQRLGLQSIYLNGVLLGVAEIIGNLIIAPIANKVHRRSLNFNCAAGEVILCFVLLLLEFTDYSQSGAIKLIQTILGCGVKVFVCINFVLIYNYCSELFPTKVRGFALGVCIIVGRSTGLISLLLVDFTDSLGIHPMIGMVFSSVIAMLFSLLLPETVNKDISN